MSKLILLALSLVSSVSVSSTSFAANRHEFLNVVVASNVETVETANEVTQGFKDELPGCGNPMVFWAMPSDGIIAMRNNDVTLTDKQRDAMQYFVSEFGSATVCQDAGALVITGQF